MAGINKVIIVGNLGNDPELRTMSNGEAMANISVATSETWTDKNSQERREVTEWHRIVFFRRQAEIAGQYLRKGSKVYVEGKLKTRKWQDANGQDRYTTEIIGDVLQMLDSRNAAGADFDNQPTQPARAPAQTSRRPSPNYSETYPTSASDRDYPAQESRPRSPMSQPSQPMPEPDLDINERNDIPF